MRRSHAPSQQGSISGRSEELEGGTIRTSAENSVYDSNAAAVKSGRCIVSRAPILKLLTVPQGPVTLTKFITPSSTRTSTSDQLIRTKFLGLRKPTAADFIKPSGWRAPLAPIVPEYVNTAEELAPEAEPEANTGTVEVEERTWEPLVLWRGEVETAEGQTAEHTIQVADRLCKVLRPHQREGVQFVFECVTGMRDFNGNGCILADDMGLGKTLQSITVLHTLLKSGFKPHERIAKKAIVVTPTSLVKNWHKELEKWLGDDRDLQVIAITDTGKTVKTEINRFLAVQQNRILIVSYETFRNHMKSFPKGCQGCCDILICDEAHRLKNAETITNQSLNTLVCRRRILLSGTPLQNDLDEFYAMVDFTNPGILGTPNEFRRNMVRHILAGREPDATDAQIAKAQDCQSQMSNLVNEFILRRTNTLNAEHLPPKLVQVVCCRLTDVQKRIYKHLLSSKEIRHIFQGKQTNLLTCINHLQKLCNHPGLLQESAPPTGTSTRGKGGGGHMAVAAGLREIAHLLPPEESRHPPPTIRTRHVVYRGRGVKIVRAELSGKMLVLERLMQEMRATGTERIVIVSNYTQTLDMISALCSGRQWPSVRLDGSTNVSKRQKLVDLFNDPLSNSFAFLLSSKAGGCGINLIGANRLVLFDPDWNPAVDKQAAARVWREGQKRRCFIYRFVSTGTIEEKIFMRQLSKEGLQSIVDDKEEVNTLSSKDLRKLFSYDDGTISDTHKKLNCPRCPLEALKSSAQDDSLLGATAPFNSAQLDACVSFLHNLNTHSFAKAVSDGVGALAASAPAPVVDGMNSDAAAAAASAAAVAAPPAELLNLGEVMRGLEAGEYTSIVAFSHNMHKLLESTDKAAMRAGDHQLQTAVYQLKTTFEREWAALVPRLLSLKPEPAATTDETTAGSCSDDVDGAPGEVKDGQAVPLKEAEGEGEVGSKFQPQVGMPLEEDLNHWSHHWSVDTCDDEAMKAAMAGRRDVVSFVFGLEVTWKLLQKYPQPEAKPKEKKKGKGKGMKGAGEEEGDVDSDGMAGSEKLQLHDDVDLKTNKRGKSQGKKTSRATKKAPKGTKTSRGDPSTCTATECSPTAGKKRDASAKVSVMAAAAELDDDPVAAPAPAAPAPAPRGRVTKKIEIDMGSDGDSEAGDDSLAGATSAVLSSTDTESETDAPQVRPPSKRVQQRRASGAAARKQMLCSDSSDDDGWGGDDEVGGPGRTKARQSEPLPPPAAPTASREVIEIDEEEDDGRGTERDEDDEDEQQPQRRRPSAGPTPQACSPPAITERVLHNADREEGGFIRDDVLLEDPTSPAAMDMGGTQVDGGEDAFGSSGKKRKRQSVGSGTKELWACGVCTLENRGRARQCEACGARRP